MDRTPNDSGTGQGDAAIPARVGQIAHDLNNVLTAILGYAEIITEDARASKVDLRDAERLLAATREAVSLTKALRTAEPREATPEDETRP